MSNPARQLFQSYSTSARVAQIVQRSALLWDTLRQRGNKLIEHERKGLPTGPEEVAQRGDESMRIVIENLPHDVSEQEVREALSPFAAAEKVELHKEGDMPIAFIEIAMTRVQAVVLATKIDGHFYKGQRLRVWVPLHNG